MNNILKMSISASALAMAMMVAGCDDDNYTMKYPPTPELPELPDVGEIHTYKAPLYWSIYEYCYEQERAGVSNEQMDFTEQQWDEVIDWMAREMKPHGYDMVCTDGWIPMLAKDASGYMTHYGSMSLKTLSEKCEAKGLRLGVYDNPLWIHGPLETKIEGTDYTFGSLRYNGTEEVNNPKNEDSWFSWVVATHPGAKEYIDGFFKHYSEMGVKYIRMDFISWYEDGIDRNMGITGRGYGRDCYARALNYVAEAAKKYGVFVSLVMPHCYNDAAVESAYGHMFRIVADTGNGGWNHASAQDRGNSYKNWPNCMNMFDGFVYWSHVAGRGKAILDGDFIRLNTFTTDAERETVVSLQLMAGGPVTIADTPSSIGNNARFFQNDEILALNADRFVGKPLSDKLNDPKNQIWYGSMTNGDVVVALFNRDDSPKAMSVELKDLGIDGKMKSRDLWKHADEGEIASVSGNVPAHGCKVVRLSK